MTRRKLALLSVAFCLAILLSGCGSSSQSSPAPPPLIVTTTTLPQGIVNSPYSATLSASGGAPPFAWNVSSGNVPPGLTLNRAGILSGTPTATGEFGFVVAVSDSEQPPSVANGNLSITITPGLQITSPAVSYGTPNVYYSLTLAATGGTAPYTWAIVQGSLPNWATFNPTTGVISGTPPGLGTTSLTVQATDSEVPPVTATASLSIVISPPPPRNAALYLTDRTGFQIQGDGSLTLLPSSPEPLGTAPLGSSPTLPVLFNIVGNPPTAVLQSILINPDYSLAPITSAPVTWPLGADYPFGQPAVDPTGSNVYLPGYIDSSLDFGVNIYLGNGSMQSVGTIAIPDITYLSQLVFTPDGTLGFIQTCPTNNNGSIRSYSRSSDGTLTPGPVYALPVGTCDGVLTVSPDGRYLAGSEYSAALPYAGLVQVYSIASDGTLTAVLPQPFTVLSAPQGGPIPITDLTWDQSGSFLLVATDAGVLNPGGGVAVLSFSGSALTETVYPTSGNVTYIVRLGSWVYAKSECFTPMCNNATPVYGFDFQGGQLNPLPGSPYQYEYLSSRVTFMAIY